MRLFLVVGALLCWTSSSSSSPSNMADALMPRQKLLSPSSSTTTTTRRGPLLNDEDDEEATRRSADDARFSSESLLEDELTETASNDDEKLDLVDESTSSTTTTTTQRRQFQALQGFTFLFVLTTSLVSFSPAVALTESLGADRATPILSAIASGAALLEIALSPAVGSVLDSVGRKPFLLGAPLAICVVNAVVAARPSPLAIGVAKFVVVYTTGLFYIAMQTMVSDLAAADNPKQLSAAWGVQRALLGAGFLAGALGGGRLASVGVSVPYLASLVTGSLAVLLVHFGMRESLSQDKRAPPFKASDMWKRILQSPTSCTRLLLRHGKQVRTLGILLSLQTLPMFMGDTFQIYAREVFHLQTKDLSSIMAMFGLFGIASNTAGSLLAPKLGIKRLTGIATFSSLFGPAGAAFFGFRGLVVGSFLGFLSGAQQLGISAALMSQGAKSGLPQGELAGERSSLIALLKVISPLLYSTLYVLGKQHSKLLGVLTSLPFLFNIGLSAVAFGLCQFCLPNDD